MKLETDPDVRAAFEADASGIRMTPDSVARPQSIDEVAELLKDSSASEVFVTPAGGQTSTTGASIVDEGVLLSLRSMNRIIDVDVAGRTARVEPGVFVGDLKRAVAGDGLTFAPDPTSEDECTIGGSVACNASGARTFKYGATRGHVRALKVVLANGEIIEPRRTDLEKNTVGYAFAHDPIDWFIGSEGTLGVIVEAEVSLMVAPHEVTGLAIPFASEVAALAFVVTARESTEVSPRCIEFFGSLALELAREADDQAGWGREASAMIYVEDESPDSLELWLALAEQSRALDDVRVFSSEAELRRARQIRHRVPSAMNERGSRGRELGGRKVSTDWAVPYRRLAEAVEMANRIADAHGVERAVVYGHAGTVIRIRTSSRATRTSSIESRKSSKKRCAKSSGWVGLLPPSMGSERSSGNGCRCR